MVEIEQRVSGLETASRKLTRPELVARRLATEAKLSGLRLEGELDVSDDLINAFAGLAATLMIKYVGLEKATKRELGIEGISADPHIVKEGAFLKEIPAPTAGDPCRAQPRKCRLLGTPESASSKLAAHTRVLEPYVRTRRRQNCCCWRCQASGCGRGSVVGKSTVHGAPHVPSRACSAHAGGFITICIWRSS